MGQIMVKTITLATGNIHKVEEINIIAKDYGIEFILPEGEFNPVEDGIDFLQNAYCKAKCAAENSKTELTLADDSGLCVEALNGAPGIYSARYDTTPQRRINKLLKAMDGIDKRDAKFVCAMVLVDKKGKIVFQTQQECLGSIMYEQKGDGGFGYDPIFFVKEKNMGMAQLSKIEKSQVSHRSKALRKVIEFLSDS